MAGQPQTYYITEADLELLNLLPLPSALYDARDQTLMHVWNSSMGKQHSFLYVIFLPCLTKKTPEKTRHMSPVCTLGSHRQYGSRVEKAEVGEVK